MITVVDYSVGNIGSILNMLRKVEIEAQASSDPYIIANAKKLILPGVGAFDAGMRALEATGIGAALKGAAQNDTPILGICLGMQLMTNGSEEGVCPGLGLVPGYCRKFDLTAQSLRVPHMGWNVVNPRPNARLFNQDEQELRFYFVHSYYVICEDAAAVAATTTYGTDFTCAFQRGMLYGAQFHPEKSHKFGMSLFRRFDEV